MYNLSMPPQSPTPPAAPVKQTPSAPAPTPTLQFSQSAYKRSAVPHVRPVPPVKKSGIGPVVGIIIIIILTGFGALYFWGAYLNRQAAQDELPFIPGDNTVQTAQ